MTLKLSDALIPKGQLSVAEDSSQIPAVGEAEAENQNTSGPSLDARIEQAQARTQQAEVRTEQAKTRIEQAETRTEQAEARTERAKTRTEQAEIRTEEAETRSEQAIRVSERSYRRLFEAARDGILILDSDTGRIKDVNPSLIEMLGFSHDELVDTLIWELGPFRDVVANKAKFEQLHKQGYVRDESLPLETRDNRKIAVEFVSTVYQDGDRNVIQCNVRDISERKKVEAQIRVLNAGLEQRVVERTVELQSANRNLNLANEKLESANTELEAYSYSVSHDLHAPLRHVVGFLKLLELDAGPSLSEKSQRHLDTVFQAAERMRLLINDLLSFSQIGKKEMQRREINLGPLVQETLKDLQAELTGRNIVWEIQPLPAVYADGSLLRMVFVNLISNAVKFTGKRTEAKIEIGCASNSDSGTVIFIRDNGAGFDPSCAEKLFGVFQRLHSNEQFEGTGIGLANVQRIIHRHGGRVWAEGAVEGGATFYFSIPRQSPESDEHERPKN